MSIERFLAPKLTGSRFEGHAIPLEFLKDLAVLEDLIKEVARIKFLEDHPERQRSPRGWTDGVELKLTAIEDGSTIPVIGLVVPDNSLFPTQSQIYFEKSRDAVVRAVHAAEQNKPVTDYLPEQTLNFFDKIGRSLKTNEAMEFTVPGGADLSTRLTRETRRRILLSSQKVEELTDEVDVRGGICEVDQVQMSFHVELIDGRKVKAPMTAQHLSTILYATTEYKNGMRVLLRGIGRFSRNERLREFESVEHVSILDTLDVPARLEELRQLEDGWLEGTGIALSGDGLDWLSQTFERRYPDNLSLPYIYPTEDGSIRAEWSTASHEISLEINLDLHAAEWHALDADSDSADDRIMNLDDSADWDWLTKRLEELGGSAE